MLNKQWKTILRMDFPSTKPLKPIDHYKWKHDISSTLSDFVSYRFGVFFSAFLSFFPHFVLLLFKLFFRTFILLFFSFPFYWLSCVVVFVISCAWRGWMKLKLFRFILNSESVFCVSVSLSLVANGSPYMHETIIP